MTPPKLLVTYEGVNPDKLRKDHRIATPYEAGICSVCEVNETECHSRITAYVMGKEYGKGRFKHFVFATTPSDYIGLYGLGVCVKHWRKK